MRGLFLATILALVSSSGAVLADGWDAAMARAAAAKEKALDGDDPTKWQEVLDLFLEADAVRTTKESKYEIAFAASRVKADDVAVEAYEASIALGLSGPPEEKAKEFLAQHAAQMGRLDVRGPEGAQVYVAGRRRATLPLARPIVGFAGTVHVRVSSTGKSVEHDVTLVAGETHLLDVGPELAPPAPIPTPLPVKVPPQPVAPKEEHTLGWALVGSGAFVTVASGVLWFVSARTVSARRESLAGVCREYRTDDPDLCAKAATPQEQEWAQQDSNLIHTFKPLRVVGAIGVGVGVLTMAIGAWQLGGKSEKVATVTPTIGREGATFTLRMTF